jgi:hypothetical protein
MSTETWNAWIRPLDAGLMVVGVRPADMAEPTWTVAADAPAHVAEYLELRPKLGNETLLLIDPQVAPDLGELRQLAVPMLVADYPDGMAGDVLLTFETLAYAPSAPPTDEVSVDLKWSLWSADEATWEECAPDIWVKMLAAYLGVAQPLVVFTAPRKEIRGGRVTIRPGAAEVSFRCTWDDIPSLMDTYGLDAENEELRADVTTYFEGGDGFDESGDTIGALEEAHVEAGTFEELIAAIDAVEDRLLAVEREHGEHFEAFCRDLRGEPTEEAAR